MIRTDATKSTGRLFAEYGRYYDLIYQDKDYAAEAVYVDGLFGRFGRPVRAVLEFGAGTGRHAEHLARLGYSMAGVERSEQMAVAARERCGAGYRCVIGDACEVDFRAKFDAVVSLFHVVSYQTSNEQVGAIFSNARRHLSPAGVFVFDVWHAAAVLTERPTVRVKRVEDDALRVTRIAEPTLETEANQVTVEYTLFVEEKRTGRIDCIAEQHLMRYFSKPELDWIAERHGFEILHVEEWLTGRPPSTSTWGVCYVARAVEKG